MNAPKHRKASTLDAPTRSKMNEAFRRNAHTTGASPSDNAMLAHPHLQSLESSRSYLAFATNSSGSSSSFSLEWRPDILPFLRVIILLTLALLKDDLTRVSMLFFIVRATDDCNFKVWVG